MRIVQNLSALEGGEGEKKQPSRDFFSPTELKLLGLYSLLHIGIMSFTRDVNREWLIILDIKNC